MYTYYNAEAQVPEVDPSTELRAEKIGTVSFVECEQLPELHIELSPRFVYYIRSPYLW